MAIDVRPTGGPDVVVRVLLPLVVVVGTVPPALVGLDAPAVGPGDLAMPPGVAVIIAGVGLAAVGAWRLVVLGSRIAPAVGLLGAAVLLGEGVAIGAELAPVARHGVVYGAAGGALAGAGLLAVLVRWRWRSRPGAPGPASLRGLLVATGVAAVVLAATRPSVPAWCGAFGALAVLLVGVPWLVGHLRRGVPRAAVAMESVVAPVTPADLTPTVETDPYATVEVARAAAPTHPSGPVLRVLHLGHAGPGSPTVEIHRRLAAAGHLVTVLAPRTADSRDRIERHGRGQVHWTHPVRRGRTRAGRLLGYAAAAVVAARHTRADVVVEELVAPLGSLAVPRWTRRPTVALATWLPAPVPAEGRAPALRLRWWAIRTHRSVIARCPADATALAAGGSRAHVVVIGTGAHDLDVLAGHTEDVYLAAVTRGTMTHRPVHR